MGKTNKEKNPRCFRESTEKRKTLSPPIIYFLFFLLSNLKTVARKKKFTRVFLDIKN